MKKIIITLALIFAVTVALFATVTKTETAKIVDVDNGVIYVATQDNMYSFYNSDNNFIKGDELTITFYTGFSNNPENYEIINIK